MIIYSWSWLGHSFVYHCTSFVPADESTNNSVNWLVDHFQGQVCSFSLIRIVNYQRIPPPFCSIYNHSTDWDSRRWRRPDAVAVLCDNHFLVPHREECVIKLTSNRHPSSVMSDDTSAIVGFIVELQQINFTTHCSRSNVVKLYNNISEGASKSNPM